MEVRTGEPPSFYQIVGMVKDTKYRDVRSDFAPIVYLAWEQTTDVDTGMDLIVRSRVSLSALTGSIKNAVASVNPAITLDFQTLHAQIGESLLQERLMALLSGFFGLLAAILATIGLYGVMSYMVSSRRSEIGIRVALGAGRKRVLGLILREAAILLSIGLVAGVALAIAAGSTAKTMLFGLKPTDPVTIAAAVLLLALVGLIASFIPARRAAAVDPMEVLRAE
jgi:ABC-type antimicrobial peptide transport system permease subunit